MVRQSAPLCSVLQHGGKLIAMRPPRCRVRIIPMLNQWEELGYISKGHHPVGIWFK